MTETFVAPTTYAEAQTMLGKTVVMPNGALGRISGCGSSLGINVDFRDPARASAGRIALWSTEYGFETMEAYKLRHWDLKATKLSKTARALIETVMPGTFERDDRSKHKDPAVLTSVAKVRLHKQGVLEYDNCGRCGGSGRYSYNQISGDRCFGCNGKGKAFPSDGAALKIARKAIKCTAA